MYFPLPYVRQICVFWREGGEELKLLYPARAALILNWLDITVLFWKVKYWFYELLFKLFIISTFIFHVLVNYFSFIQACVNLPTLGALAVQAGIIHWNDSSP